jgi:hypothetical protein
MATIAWFLGNVKTIQEISQDCDTKKKAISLQESY